jgi:hypothetical protein
MPLRVVIRGYDEKSSYNMIGDSKFYQAFFFSPLLKQNKSNLFINNI